MRVLVLADLNTIHTIRWYDALSEHFDVRVVSLENPLEERDDFLHLRPRIESHRWKYILSLRRVKAVVDDFQPDLLNPHFIPNYGLLSALVSGGRPCVLCVWGSDLLQVPRKSRFHRRVTRWILERMDEVIVDARMMVPILKDFGVQESRTFVMPFGLREELREAPLGEVSGDLCRFVTHRRFVPEMDPLTLIRALGLVKANRDDFEAFLCSAGPLEDASKSLVRELGLADRVRFPGRVGDPELFGLLRSAHLYLSSSVTDSTSVSLLEAMACGAVPVVSDIEGNREWVRDGENGRLFEVGNARGLASALESTMEDRAFVLRARERNKRMIRERANWEENVRRVARRMTALVSKTCSSAPRGD